MQNLSASKW